MTDKLENMRKASKLIGKTSKALQIICGIFTGMFLIAIILLSITRNTLKIMSDESLASFDFSHMGYWAEKLAGEGNLVDAAIIFALSGLLFSLMVTIVMRLIAKIFKKICDGYSPFLPEIVKDLKIVSVLATLLILRNSMGIGIISGFVFWGMIRLYEYGCELQNQVDETL